MREDYYAGLEDRYFLTYDQAKEQKLKIDFDVVPPAPAPNKIGVTVIDSVSLEDVVPYIDWVSLSFSREYLFVCISISLIYYLCLFMFRIHSSKHGNFVDDTPTVATLKYSMMKLSVVKPKSFLMMPRS